MPRLSCWFIRAALVHLSVGVTMGGLILTAKAFPGVIGWSWYLLPAHIQLLVGGWLVQLTLGMAYWILPRLNAQGNRGREGLAVTSFITLNAGVASSAALLLVRAFYPQTDVGFLLILTALLQVFAPVAFVGHAWRRVRQPWPTSSPPTSAR